MSDEHPYSDQCRCDACYLELQSRLRQNSFAATAGSSASIVEAIKETYRHMEELYRQAGEGRIVENGLAAARERANALTQALIRGQHLNS